MDAKEWFDLRQRVISAAPYLDPPPQYWLESDCTETFCRSCAIKERGKEFDLGAPIEDVPWYRRDPMVDAFFEGLSSYAYRCAGHSDTIEACARCGITLDYWLTDEGIQSEIDHWSDSEMLGDLSEIAYNLDRLFECKDEDRPAVAEIAKRFLEFVEASK